MGSTEALGTFLVYNSLSNDFSDNWVNKDFLNNGLFEDFVNDVFFLLEVGVHGVLFSDNGEMFLLNQSGVLFVDDRLMVLVDVFLVDDWLVVLMDDVLVMLVNNVFLVFNENILVVLVDDILMDFFHDGSSGV